MTRLGSPRATAYMALIHGSVVQDLCSAAGPRATMEGRLRNYRRNLLAPATKLGEM